MPATVTLSSTTLTDGVDDKNTRIKVGSTTGMLPGLRLYCEGELMRVVWLEVDPFVTVARGADGTFSTPHSSSAIIYIGRADQFYFGPPMGRPCQSVLVSPYIDALNGKVYFAQGDANQLASRWWQQQTATYGYGALGVRTVTYDPTSST